VNMQAAMQMIPKPIELTPPQVQQTHVRPDMQPGQGGNMSLADRLIIDFYHFRLSASFAC
jgi:hypothetical protein